MRKFTKLRKRVMLFRAMAQGLSIVAHPLLLPTYIIILLSIFSPISISPLNSLAGRKFLLSLIFMSTFFLPFLIFVFYIMIRDRNWTVRSFFVENSKDRIFPFLIIGVFYSVLIYFIRRTPQLNDLILIVLTSVTVSILIVALISNFWKISVHAVGISGMIALLTVVNNKAPDAILFYPVLILIIFSGFLMSARLYLNAHTPAQVLVGYILGVFIGSTSYLFI